MSKERVKNGFAISILRTIVISIIIALSSILIFALILKFSDLKEGAIKTINQFIKTIAIFVGCFFSLRGEKGIIKGAVSGGLFTIIIYLLLGLIGGNLAFSVWFLLEILFGIIVGAISGIITVNVKK